MTKTAPDDRDEKSPKISLENLRPFLGPVFLTAADEKTDLALLDSVADEVGERIATAGEGNRTIAQILDDQQGGLDLRAIVYVREAAPAWAPQSSLRDCANELAVIAVKGKQAAVCASENALRDWIPLRLKSARPIPFDSIERAFVGTQAKAMWLRGGHTPTASKATAKSLIGPSLEDAIDPLGDQTYFYSAVRTIVPIVQKDARLDSAVGAAPRSSRIWLNRPKKWESFCHDLEMVLDRASAPPLGPRPFPALAQRLPDLTGVSDAYEMGVVPMELLSESDDTLRDLAQRWAYESEFRITGRNGPSLETEVRLEGIYVGRVKLAVGHADKVVIEPQWTDEPAGAEEQRKQFEDQVIPNWLKIYYKNGITIANGDAFRMTWRDQAFNWDFKNLDGYDVRCEKPTRHGGLSLAQCIGTAKRDGSLDDSLFGYIVRVAFKTGWLASDDGSMELADFIHVDPAGRMVTLIHAKGSKSKAEGRRVAVAQYEVVVGQAVKNLRHLDRIILADALEAGKDKKIARAIWRNGVPQSDRSGMIADIRALGDRYEKQVIVFQPQLTEREHDACVGPASTAKGDRLIRMKQLDTLMLSARLSARAIGADLIGWGDGTPAKK